MARGDLYHAQLLRQFDGLAPVSPSDHWRRSGAGAHGTPDRGATAGFIGVDRLKLALIKILDLWLARAVPGNGEKAGENRNGNDEQ